MVVDLLTTEVVLTAEIRTETVREDIHLIPTADQVAEVHPTVVDLLTTEVVLTAEISKETVREDLHQIQDVDHAAELHMTEVHTIEAARTVADCNVTVRADTLPDQEEVPLIPAD